MHILVRREADASWVATGGLYPDLGEIRPAVVRLERRRGFAALRSSRLCCLRAVSLSVCAATSKVNAPAVERSVMTPVQRSMRLALITVGSSMS